jgi:hypothetical protein
MKLAAALVLALCADFFGIISTGIAQEHVDVPLPPYDPPPTISHHSQSRHDEPIRGTENPRTYRHHPEPSKATPAKEKKQSYSNRNLKGTKPHSTRNQDRRHSRKHFHWPWQHHK